MRAILIHQDGKHSIVDVVLKKAMFREQIAEQIKTMMNDSGLLNKVVKVIIK